LSAAEYEILSPCMMIFLREERLSSKHADSSVWDDERGDSGKSSDFESGLSLFEQSRRLSGFPSLLDLIIPRIVQYLRLARLSDPAP
jgi:hypothetical protein